MTVSTSYIITVTVVCKMEGIEKSINVGDRFPTYLENVIYYIKCQTANTEYMPQTSLIAMLSNWNSYFTKNYE